MKNITYTVPENDKEIFVAPAIDCIPDLVRENKHKLGNYAFEINGIPFQALRDKSREELLHKAVQYTHGIKSLLRTQGRHGQTNLSTPPVNSLLSRAISQYQDEVLGKMGELEHKPMNEVPIILTGHEPVFYHPCIWVKNHLAHHVAKRVGGIGINMIVDNDACTMGFVYAPTLSENSLHIQKIPLVEGKDRVAYEEIVLDDFKILHRFREEILSLLKNNALNADALSCKSMEKGTIALPLCKNIRTMMDDMQAAFEGYIARVVACRERGCVDMVGLLTAARVALEEEFQMKNLEIPVSRMCSTDGFHHFFLHVLHNAGRFARIYNAKLSEYRGIHKIRSKANPLPDLNVGNNITELPFWVWKQGEERRRCYLLNDGDLLKITDGIHVVAILKKNEDGSENMQKIRALQEDRIKLRPRAITTTMFSRLFFSDVFIHGIGGAKYDTITDEIIQEFFGISPPSYVTNSATLFLPLSAFDRDIGSLPLVQREVRDMPHNPERYASKEILNDADFANRVKEKKRILAIIEGCGMDEKKAYFHQIKALNKLLFDQIRAEFFHKQNEQNALINGLAHENAVKFREYPVCMFPTEFLRGHYTNVFSEG
ncbi:MAG: hypothetical protein HZB37_12005 [Planctomycetes bacterium]|nr:hypothetical protein [Planctomycetota bacterium]